MTHCFPCLSNSGESRISPGAPILHGKYWVLEHAYPTGLLGWLVIVLKRHCERLHELTPNEWQELAEFQYRSILALRQELKCEREYTACFAELEGFKHIHFHVVPKTDGFTPETSGIRAFQYLDIERTKPVEPEVVGAFCERMRSVITQL